MSPIFQPGVPEQLPGGGPSGWCPPGPSPGGDETGSRFGLWFRGGQREAGGGALGHTRSVKEHARTTKRSVLSQTAAFL